MARSLRICIFGEGQEESRTDRVVSIREAEVKKRKILRKTERPVLLYLHSEAEGITIAKF